MLVSLSDVHKTYGELKVLRGVTFGVAPKDRIALVGRNGSGKTTILRLIAGLEEPDSGTVSSAGRTGIAFRPQQNDLEPDRTVMQEMKSAWGLEELESELKLLDARIESGEATEKDKNRQAELWDLFEHRGGHVWRHESEKILHGLGLANSFHKKTRVLSGGEKTKVSLAKILAGSGDLLILDEPSNHLDLDTTIWLEQFLAEYGKALIIVTHDRHLMDRVATCVIELENGQVEVYNGPYEFYVEERQVRRDNKRKAYERQQEFIAREQEFIRRNIEGQKTRQAQGRRKKLSRLKRLQKPYSERSYKFPLEPRSRSGEIALRLEDLSIELGDRTLFKNLDLELYRGEKIGIIGPNGCGKTTLLRIIAGKLDPSQGRRRLGSGVDISFFDQEHTDLSPDATPLDVALKSIGEPIESVARDVLGAFGFGELAAEKNISALSGGEKTRIALMRTVLSGANLLLLDEPTNHLDIVCIESLERSLLEYTGTLMVVSHDRSFLYNVCDRYLLIEREPRILVDRNDLERYLESQSEPERDARSKRPEGAQKRRIRRSLNNEAKRFNQWLQELEDETVRMESERKELQRRMAESADSYEKAAELAIEEKELCRRIEENYENMVVAEEKLSEIEKKLGEL